MDCSNVETNSTMICVISFNRRIHGHHKLLLANLSTTSKGSTERLRSLYRNAIRNPQGKDLEFIQSNLLELNTNHQMNNGLHNNLNGGTMKILKDLYVLRDASLTVTTIKNQCSVTTMKANELIFAIQCLSNCSLFNETLDLFEEALDKNPSIIKTSTLSVLFQALSYSRNESNILRGYRIYRDAILDQSMPHLQVDKELSLFNAIVNLIVLRLPLSTPKKLCNELCDDMTEIFDILRVNGNLSPITHAQTYGFMIRIFGRFSSLDTTYGFYTSTVREFRQAGAPVPDFIHSIMIGSAAKREKWDVCLHVFARARKEDNPKIGENAFVFSKVVGAAASAGELHFGFETFDAYRRTGGEFTWQSCSSALRLVNAVRFPKDKHTSDIVKKDPSLQKKADLLLKRIIRNVLSSLQPNSNNLIPAPVDLTCKLLPDLAVSGQIDVVFNHLFWPPNGRIQRLRITPDALKSTFQELLAMRRWREAWSLQTRLAACPATLRASRLSQTDTAEIAALCSLALFSSSSSSSNSSSSSVSVSVARRSAWPLILHFHNYSANQKMKPRKIRRHLRNFLKAFCDLGNKEEGEAQGKQELERLKSIPVVFESFVSLMEKDRHASALFGRASTEFLVLCLQECAGHPELAVACLRALLLAAPLASAEEILEHLQIEKEKRMKRRKSKEGNKEEEKEGEEGENISSSLIDSVISSREKEGDEEGKLESSFVLSTAQCSAIRRGLFGMAEGNEACQVFLRSNFYLSSSQERILRL